MLKNIFGLLVFLLVSNAMAQNTATNTPTNTATATATNTTTNTATLTPTVTPNYYPGVNQENTQRKVLTDLNYVATNTYNQAQYFPTLTPTPTGTLVPTNTPTPIAVNIPGAGNYSGLLHATGSAVTLIPPANANNFANWTGYIEGSGGTGAVTVQFYPMFGATISGTAAFAVTAAGNTTVFGPAAGSFSQLVNGMAASIGGIGASTTVIVGINGK